MDNPFLTIDRRLGVIEDFLLDIRQQLRTSTKPTDFEQSEYGNFVWFCSEFGLPQSTARQLAPQVEGAFKPGKTWRFHKQKTRIWMESRRRKSKAETTSEAEIEFAQRHTSSRRKKVA